jgi:bifunctional ADP-heptose synthase (sugar kinase/adenylyltransferase)
MKILVIGDSCLDRYRYGTCERISPEAPVPIMRHVETFEYPGMALNVVENLKAFDVDVDLITNTEVIIKERFVDIKSKHHLLRADFGETERIKEVDNGLISDRIKQEYDVIIISDYDKGFISLKNINDLIGILIKKSIPIFVDTKKTDLTVFTNCIIKINEIEDNRIDEKSRISLIKKNISLIVTLGENGARFQGKHYPANKVNSLDVSGAGDTFLAALVYSYMKNNSNIEKAIHFANKCASIVVQKNGTYAITKQDIEKNEICI